MMLIAVSNRGEVGEQERIITTQGTFPQETDTHNPPLFNSSISPLPICFVGGLTFPSPRLRNNQLLLFYICVIVCLFFLLLFRRDIFSDVEVASCVLRRLLCAQLSAVVEESLEELKRGRGLGHLQGQWFPTRGLGPPKRNKSEGYQFNQDDFIDIKRGNLCFTKNNVDVSVVIFACQPR